ncbi:MAG: (2Fe-2S) ferredoxin domain-containing protein [Firmicutes bacterium]|nr:(2Fe-2S) ferredoxin domain-containing protein [Bacillota bacterium]
MKSLAELENLRKKMQEELKLREGEQQTKIIVGMGTCGIAAGAREVLSAILDELARRRLTGVTVTQTGCAGKCDVEPLVEVIKPGEEKVTYQLVDGEKARRIVIEHVVNNREVLD